MNELRENLMAVCTLMVAEIPELNAWRKEFQQEQAYRATWQNPEVQVIDDWQSQLARAPQRKRRKPSPPLSIPKIVYKGVGRNDPCPCKSGKKYKHCCLRR